jgi:uncharacterized protein
MNNHSYHLALPTFNRHLGALSKMLDKAAAHAADKKFDEAILVQGRLAPDMFALARQVQIAADFAKGCAARLAGIDIPKYADTETTIAQLQARIAQTLDFINGIAPAQFDQCDARSFAVTLGGQETQYTGASFARDAALPHFYFHVVTAYAILRTLGVNVGKLDYFGA